MHKVVQCILLKTMAALAVLEDIANGAIRRERVFRDRHDLLAHEDKWLISRFRFPRAIILKLCAELQRWSATQHGATRCLFPYS